jgi:CRISPR/Cas system-associated endoribonuclease Cas2
MSPTLFKALQFAVTRLGIGELRLKQQTTGHARPLKTMPMEERPREPSPVPDWDATRSFSMQLVRLARGTNPGRQPIFQNEPARTETTSRAFALAIGYPAALQNRLRQVFASAFECELQFVALDSIQTRRREVSGAAIILINIASIAVTKRLGREFRGLVESGRPTLLTGSRAALRSLGVLTDCPETEWDFLPVPWDRDELIWRIHRLTQREPLAIPVVRGQAMRQAC